jgi:hypothetical protein
MEWIIVHPHEAMLMSREAVRIKEVLGIDAIINEYEKAI